MVNRKPKYGTKTLDADEFDPKHTSVRISLVMEADLLHAIKKSAEKSGRAYQTELKRILRAHYLGEISPSHSDIERRIAALEEKIQQKFQTKKKGA